MKNLFKKHWMVLLVPFGVILDQITKHIARTTFSSNKVNWIIEDLFGWTLSFNTGGPWSVFSGATIILTIFSVVISVALVFFYIKKKEELKPFYRLILCLLLAGAIGNLIDRALFAKVTDFIYFNFFIIFNSTFPIFNVADIFVVAGMIGLIIVMLFDKDFDKIFSLKDKGEHHD